MKFSESWLREWINPALSREELAAQLTMAGLEVDGISLVAASFAGVVVGEISELAPHPTAAHLQVCQVNVGDTQPLTIVCGATNVRVGMRAPLAIAGAQLADGASIAGAVLQGVESQGMLCSAAELGLADHSSGLLELPHDTRIGEDVYQYLKLDDVTIELGLTPNRGDCLSVMGIAREVAALNGSTLHGFANSPVAGTLPDHLSISIAAPEHCPRYVGRVIRGIDALATTPLWMQERLRRSGLRSISPVVDVTNTVLLELGQPMHAFDLAKVREGIQVRLSLAGEMLVLLDGQSIRLTEGTLVIADAHRPLAIAGIMGGLDSAISDNTTDLFLESAFFTPLLLAGRARSYGLHTDSSFRFERGVDFALPETAMERATALLLDIVGGQAGPVIEICSEPHLPLRSPIALQATLIPRVLGMDIAAAEVTDILSRLGMQVLTRPDGWLVTPPSYRFDIGIDVDLIEEIARIYGYNRLPVRTPQVSLAMTPQTETRLDMGRLRNALVDRGYQEIVSYSFVDPVLQKQLDPQHTPMTLANPIASDMAVMRTSLWCGLLKTLLHNQKRQQARLRLFEIGVNFLHQDEELTQEKYIAGVVTGNLHPEQWALPAQAADWFDVKADVESLIWLTGRPQSFSFQAGKHPALHPGQTARIYQNGQAIGWLGALHPLIGHELDIGGHVYLFELLASSLENVRLPAFCELSRFPAIRRDIAVLVAAATPAQAICTVAQESAGEVSLDVQLFDVYQGKGIDSSRKSVALGLTLRAPSRTLTDQEADAIIQRIIDRLHTQLGATLRQ